MLEYILYNNEVVLDISLDTNTQYFFTSVFSITGVEGGNSVMHAH